LKTAARLARVCEILRALYQDEMLNNKENPTDEYFFLILSSKTSYKLYEQLYEELYNYVQRDWNNIITLGEGEIERIIRRGGLSRLKAHWIKEASNKMKSDFGKVTLEPLRTWDDHMAEKYLLGLPGAGVKIAKAIMMYSLGRKVLPVDTHTYKIAVNIGLIEDKWDLRNERGVVHQILESIVPPDCRRVFHVGSVVIGRTFCRPGNPLCESCPLKNMCLKRESRS